MLSRTRRQFKLWYLGRKSGLALSSLNKMIGKLKSSVNALNREISVCDAEKQKVYEGYQKKVIQLDAEKSSLEGLKQRNQTVLGNLVGLFE